MKKYLIFISLCLILLLITVFVTLKISNSRSFQFFGDITRRVETKQKVVALTYDDAPGSDTKDILLDLDKFGVKATFFAIGSAIEKYKPEAERIVTAGHELGNHTYSHERMIFKTPAFIRSEIERTDKLIRQTGYRGAIYFRPPNGKKLLLLPWYFKAAQQANHNVGCRAKLISRGELKYSEYHRLYGFKREARFDNPFAPFRQCEQKDT